MPTYQYKCEACGFEFEKFQPITAKPIKKCPECGKSRVKRLIGTGAGLIFKGGGFYITDYRSESYKSAAKAESTAAAPAKEAGSGSGGDGAAKPASSEAKPAATEAKPAAAAKPEAKAAAPAGAKAEKKSK